MLRSTSSGATFWEIPMDKLIETIRRPSRLIATIALGVSAVCTLLTYAGTFPKGFMPVVAHLILMLFDLTLIGGLLFLLIAHHDKGLDFALPLLFAWWLLNVVKGRLEGAYLATRGMPGITIACGIFEFFVGLAFLAATVLLVVAKFKENARLRSVGFAVAFGTLPLLLLVMVLSLADNGVNGYAWPAYFGAFNALALPVGMLFAYFPMAFPKPLEAPEEEPDEIFAQEDDYVVSQPEEAKDEEETVVE